MVERENKNMENDENYEGDWGLPSEHGDGKWRPGSVGRPPRWWKSLQELEPIIWELERLQKSGTLGAVLSFSQFKDKTEDETDRRGILKKLFGRLGLSFGNDEIGSLILNLVEDSVLDRVMLAVGGVAGIVSGVLLWYYLEEKVDGIPPVLHTLFALMKLLDDTLYSVSKYLEGTQQYIDSTKKNIGTSAKKSYDPNNPDISEDKKGTFLPWWGSIKKWFGEQKKNIGNW